MPPQNEHSDFMKKRGLSLCNGCLLLLLPAVVGSSLVLEFRPEAAWLGLGAGIWVGLHAVVSLSMAALAVWHLRLHWGCFGEWCSRLRRHPAAMMRWLFGLLLLTCATGVVSLPLWMVHGHHGFGGLHGKLGMACGVLMLVHLVQRRRWYGRQ